MAPPTLPFGMMVNGFHPQMTALPNPVGPLGLPQIPPYSRSNTAAGLASSSSSSSQQQPSLPQISLSGLIDTRTSTLMNKLRDDVQNEERHRRTMVKKRRRTGYGSSSSSSSRSSSSSYSSSSFSESDTSSRSSATSRSLSSSSDASSAATRRSRDHKRQRTTYYKEIPRVDPSVTKIDREKTFAAAPVSFLSAANAPLKSFSSSASTTAEPCYDSTSPLSSSGSDTDQASTKASSSTASGLEDAYANGAGGFSDLYSEVFLESEKPQIIATLGGRIVTWNDEFLSSTGLLPSQLRGCVTVHNLVEPAMQSRLNDLFELALREGDTAGSGRGGDRSNCNVVDPARPPLMVIAPAAGGGRGGGLTGRRELRQVPAPRPGGVGVDVAEATPLAPVTPDIRNGGIPAGQGKTVPNESAKIAVPGLEAGTGSYDAAATQGLGASESGGEEEEDGETHLSITLPCRRFRSATEQLCITIILMNDIDPSKRCFYCILNPPANPPPTISFPAASMASMTPQTPENNSGGYKSIGNGWYRSLHTSDPFPNSLAMPAQMQTMPMTSPVTGKIRRIGQKQLASLL